MAKATPYPTAAAFLPKKRDLSSLRQAAEGCEGCPLFANATQTVFGEGPARAKVVFVGEQPGDSEDLAGKPFVGPAGKLMDRVMAEAGIPRKKVYVTNAVKHFKWEPRGKKRLHSKPGSREIAACRPWLESELQWIKPEMIVLLGATAAQALLGPKFRLTKQRGEPVESAWADWVIATYHPSAILRAMSQPDGEVVYQQFLADMQLVAERLVKLK